jgi:hypothetical protein
MVTERTLLISAEAFKVSFLGAVAGFLVRCDSLTTFDAGHAPSLVLANSEGFIDGHFLELPRFQSSKQCSRACCELPPNQLARL